jgi:hypothetical protein
MKDLRDRRILELWMACYTHEEIAEALECPKRTVTDAITTLGENGKPAASAQSAAAQHLTDFDPPLYNVWKQQERTPGVGHFGNSEVRWLDNLLYLYTQVLGRISRSALNPRPLLP